MLLVTLFNKINLKPPTGYLFKMIPCIFMKTSYGMTDLKIDVTDFKFANASNCELILYCFHIIKPPETNKVLVGISLNGGEMIFNETYPCSISDSELNEKCGVNFLVQEGHEILSDRGFSVQALCAVRDIT